MADPRPYISLALTQNFPCIDSLLFLRSSGELYLFEITRAETHSIKSKPFHDLLRNMKCNNEINKVYLVFVLPDNIAEERDWQRSQSITGKSGNSSKTEIIQYRMSLSKADAEQVGDPRRAIP